MPHQAAAAPGAGVHRRRLVGGRSLFPHVQPALAVPLPSPSPTEKALLPEGTAWMEIQKRQGVVTVVSTIASDSGSSSSTPVPVGPIVGGIIAGIVIVLLAGGFWWWWVANKPKAAAPRQARIVPDVAPGMVPLPTSFARSRPSATNLTSPASSTSHQPQMNERGWTPPIVAGAGGSSSLPRNNSYPAAPPPAKVKGARSTSGSSDTPLLSSSNSSGSSSSSKSKSKRGGGAGGQPQLGISTSPSKKTYNPSKPSPLSAGAASTAPKWGQMPFVTSPARSNEGHSSSQGHGGGPTEMDVLSTSPNSITPLNNKHLEVTRSPSAGMLSSSSHGSGPGDRMSMVSEGSRYSQGGNGIGGVSVEGHQGVELGRQVSGEWGVAYDVEEDRSPRDGVNYGYGGNGAGAGGHEENDEAYGYVVGGSGGHGGREEVMRNEQQGGRDSGSYLDDELDSYYRPRSGI